MPAKKSAPAKKTVRKTKRDAARTTVRRDDEFSVAMILGVFSLLIAMAGLVSFRIFMGTAAISLGLVSMWLAIRNHEFKYLFLGVAGTLISLVALWDFAIFTELATDVMTSGY